MSYVMVNGPPPLVTVSQVTGFGVGFVGVVDPPPELEPPPLEPVEPPEGVCELVGF